MIDDPNGKISALRKNPEKAPVLSNTSGAVVPRSTSAIATFFTRYQAEFGTMSPTTVSNLTQLFTFIDQDTSITDPRHVAYILATIKQETADTFKPIRELCSEQVCKRYGEKYRGRGYIQLTREENYKKFGGIFGVDLLTNPEMALEPQIAYRVTSVMMENGLATGKKLSDYIGEDKADYLNARRVVGGLDHAQLIAGYAERFEAILRDSLSVETRTSRPAATP